MILDETEHKSEDMVEEIRGKEVQKRDLALADIVIAASQNCKAAVRKIRCLPEVWTEGHKMFRAVSEAAVDAKLTTVQNIFLDKSESNTEYSNRILESVSELE